ncbi:hypothetical protein J2S74_000057 [Evansella vedderi]|uniref:Uncharacterized protein n=1 Tax=Evansella vedderi TaxID=38282 RepID=A0ABT9ZR91_9BACI|nr:hypothetical protein [Evansella vedderi]MDQ0252685.1 hypothetical protein [Evansella vedderi]
MKRKLLFIFLPIIAVGGIFAVWYTYPKEIDQTLHGVKYQLGSENANFEEQMTIDIFGKVQRNLLGE